MIKRSKADNASQVQRIDGPSNTSIKAGMNVNNSARGGSLSTWRELTLVAHQHATNATRQAATCSGACYEGPDDDEEARRDQDGEINPNQNSKTVSKIMIQLHWLGS